LTATGCICLSVGRIIFVVLVVVIATVVLMYSVSNKHRARIPSNLEDVTSSILKLEYDMHELAVGP